MGLPRDHRVWAWHGRGEPDALRLEDRPLPVPGPGEVLLENRAIGLNPVDWKMIAWGNDAWAPGHIPGVDGCGTLAACGEGVHLPLGTRYAYHQGLARDGSFAGFTLADARGLIPVPETVDDRLAAALPCPGLTAWQALAKLPGAGGRDILVAGAGGAVGRILAQLALRGGWRVWTTAAPDHEAELLALGVSGSFDYRQPDWQERLSAALGPRRLFAIFDTISGDHARGLAPLVGYNGHLICIQDRIEQAPLPAFSTAISLHEVALNSIHHHATHDDWRLWRAAGQELFALLETGQIVLPRIESSPFAELPRALVRLRQGGRPVKYIATL